MRELDRELLSSDTPACTRLAIVGRGRLGSAVAGVLAEHPAYAIVGPLGRGVDGSDADAVLLCVPDAQIGAAAALIAPGRLVGHCSGATGLDVLGSHERFVVHPLMTVTARGASFAGAGAAVDGSSDRALAFADGLARALALVPVRLSERDRPAYHAAASIASNFLLTLEATAERMAATAGVSREMLLPLVRATVDNWAELGAAQALTGPVARGDEITVERQRAAVAERAPELLALFDALVQATRTLAGAPPEAEVQVA
jgi:predicted short-subunit dehydrogenase-like oxidoreductase (DUF2520 family)